jgi:glycosyltransferase involved in cell wall biosynthesis
MVPPPTAGGGATGGDVVYILRTHPEPSETFIRREIDGLIRVGIPVTIVALERVDSGEAVGSSHGADAPAVHYLRDARSSTPATGDRPGAGAVARLASAVARDVAHLKAHPRRAARALRLARYAIRGCRRVPPGSRRLHAHFANDAAALARYLGILTGVPYVVTAHAYDIYQDPFLLGRNLAAASHVFTVSESNLRTLRSRVVLPSDRLSVLHCAIDLRDFPYRDPEPPRTPARVLCVARLVPKKGHAVLIQALKTLRDRGLPAELTLAGDGPLEPELRALVERLGLESAVELLGNVPGDRVLDLMRRSDVVALASRVADDGDRDGLPVVLMEACALGIPVVSTDVSGIPELVSTETGRLAPPDRPDQLANALRDSLAEPQEARVARTRRARRKVEAEFDLERLSEFLASL